MTCECGCGQTPAMTTSRFMPGHHMQMRAVPVRERLYRSLAPCPDSGCECVLWTLGTDRGGYGRINVKGSQRTVHRIAWELANGPIPDGLVIDHVRDRGCNHRNCANVAHMELVTNTENVLRGDGVTAANAAKTHCLVGHPFDEANTYVSPAGKRSCRPCNLAHHRRYYAMQRGAA